MRFRFREMQGPHTSLLPCQHSGTGRSSALAVGLASPRTVFFAHKVGDSTPPTMKNALHLVVSSAAVTLFAHPAVSAPFQSIRMARLLVQTA
mmetsp:Transcript_60674/g.107733  ORF Transcript_60674/g.107733 Transcript_60674/m.107733 type:complete len:92 (+) Transcript_60674:54-329(+)